MNFKKAISPVVAIALLLVVSVVAVVGYQNWYAGYQSILTSDVEQRSTSSGSINIEYISSDGTLYVTNSGNSNLTIGSLEISGSECVITDELAPGVNKVDISSCLSDTGTNNIVIVTDSGIIEESLFVEELSLPCTLDGITLSQDENHTFYNSLICDSQNRFCISGSLNGSDTFNISNVGSCSAVALYDTTNNLYWDMNMNRFGTKKWALVADASYSEPTWNESLGIYNYPNALTKSDYPAFESCEDLTLGGYADWQLPTKDEFLNLQNTEVGGWGQTNYENYGFTNYVNSYCWSSNEFPTTSAFAIYLAGGGSSASGKTTGFYVTCVRRD